MKESLYSRRSNLIIGFHGCDQTVVDKVLAGEENLLASTNDYDGWVMASTFRRTIMQDLPKRTISRYASAIPIASRVISFQEVLIRHIPIHRKTHSN